MKIIIEVIPHNKQRYNTIGDWQWSNTPDETLSIKVSELPSRNGVDHRFMETLIGIHEAVEAICCLHDGVHESEVDRFDQNLKHQRFCVQENIEPGDHPQSPYMFQHSVATGVERFLSAAWGVSWYEYERILEEVSDSYESEQD